MFKRRSFLLKSLGIAGSISLPFIAKSSEIVKQKPIKGRFSHMVFFWLNEDVDNEAFMNNTKDLLSKIEVVKSYHIGQPAGTPREVVDNSYSVSLVATFDSKADQDTYQSHAAHITYLNENKSKWNKVQIYDSWGFE